MKKRLAPGALLSPVPPVLVTCKSGETANVLTIAWAGIISTKPPMTYISVRPSRFSHRLIEESGEFVINLTTAEMVRSVDLCGVKSGSETDKFALCGLETETAEKVGAPLLKSSPVCLECVVKEKKSFGSHDMFTAEIVSVSAEEDIINSKGRLCLDKCGLLAYAHGDYFTLGKKLGYFGFSVKKKKTRSKH